jgi:hypothetical protein
MAFNNSKRKAVSDRDICRERVVGVLMVPRLPCLGDGNLNLILRLILSCFDFLLLDQLNEANIFGQNAKRYNRYVCLLEREHEAAYFLCS